MQAYSLQAVNAYIKVQWSIHSCTYGPMWQANLYKLAGSQAAPLCCKELSKYDQNVFQSTTEFCAMQMSHVASIRAFETAKPAPQVVADVAEVATDLKFEPEKVSLPPARFCSA